MIKFRTYAVREASALEALSETTLGFELGYPRSEQGALGSDLWSPRYRVNVLLHESAYFARFMEGLAYVAY